MEIINRKANHEYFIHDRYEAGIELMGTEIKSIKKGSVSLNDCYGRVKNGEIYLLNMSKVIYLIMMKEEIENYYFIKKKY